LHSFVAADSIRQGYGIVSVGNHILMFSGNILYWSPSDKCWVSLEYFNPNRREH